MEWVRFGFAALFLIAGIAAFMIGVFGIYKLKFVLNRMHSAAILDTMGLLFVIISLLIAKGFTPNNIKILLIVAFLWLTSPIASHLIAKMEFFTDKGLSKEINNDINKIKGGDKDDYSNL